MAGGRRATGPGSAKIRDHEAVWDRLREELSGRGHEVTGHEVTATWLGTTAPQRAGCRRTYKWPGCVEVLMGLGHGATVMRPRGLETTGPWDTGPRGHGATWPRSRAGCRRTWRATGRRRVSRSRWSPADGAGDQCGWEGNRGSPADRSADGTARCRHRPL